MSNAKNEPVDPSQQLTIEVGREPRSTTCGQCGRAAVDTTGFVYRGGDAFAIYHATLHNHGELRQTDLAIGIGTWQADEAVADVSAFLAVWPEGDEIRFGFVDPDRSVWASAGLLRGQLTADEARISPSRPELLRVAERIVKDDPAISRHLG
jgi:hypothetical protein